MKKVTYLLKISNFGTLKVMKTCPVIRFLGTFFAQALGSWGNFVRPRFCTRRTSVPTFIRELPPPPPSLLDQFIQEWIHDVSSTNSSISQYYRLFKKSFNTEDYLTQLSGQNKCIFTKLRLSLLKFPVTTGRYDDIPYEQRYCTL